MFSEENGVFWVTITTGQELNLVGFGPGPPDQHPESTPECLSSYSWSDVLKWAVKRRIHRGPAEFWPQGGLSPKFAKIAWKLHDFEKILEGGGSGGRAPRALWIRQWYTREDTFFSSCLLIGCSEEDRILYPFVNQTTNQSMGDGRTHVQEWVPDRNTCSGVGTRQKHVFRSGYQAETLVQEWVPGRNTCSGTSGPEAYQALFRFVEFWRMRRVRHNLVGPLPFLQIWIRHSHPRLIRICVFFSAFPAKMNPVYYENHTHWFCQHCGANFSDMIWLDFECIRFSFVFSGVFLPGNSWEVLRKSCQKSYRSQKNLSVGFRNFWQDTWKSKREEKKHNVKHTDEEFKPFVPGVGPEVFYGSRWNRFSQLPQLWRPENGHKTFPNQVLRKQGRIQDFGQGGPSRVLTRGGGLSPKKAKNCLKIAWLKKKILGGAQPLGSVGAKTRSSSYALHIVHNTFQVGTLLNVGL